MRQIDAGLLELFLQLLRRADLVLLGAPARGQRGRALFEIGKLAFEPREAIDRGAVGLLLQRLLLDPELHDAAIDLVEFFRLRIDLHAQARRRLVHEVDRLVGQEAVGDVAVRQGRGRDERRILHAHAVVQFVLLLQAAQDRDRVRHLRLGHEHRLEATRERRVLLDMLAIFIERRRADAMQFAARQRRFEQVRRVHRAVRLAGADERVHLVDEQDDAACRRRDLAEHGLQPLLELAAIFRAGDERAHVEREQLLVAAAHPARRR